MARAGPRRLERGGARHRVGEAEPCVAERAAAERSIGLIGAPGLRGRGRALAGELTVMVGGEPEEVERAHPVLDAVGGDIRHAGPSGAGRRRGSRTS
jgi:3-hydroxyisobutyrate dehydrogenase